MPEEQLDIFSSYYEAGPQGWSPPPPEPPADLAAPQRKLMSRNDLVSAPDGLWARPIQGHSLEKADHVSRYARTVAAAMRRKFELWWVELFAGPGCLVHRGTFINGSPLDALATKPPFHGYVFADYDEDCINSLTPRVGASANVHVLHGDANNSEHLDRVTALVPQDALVIAYLDPQGLNLHFDTIRRLAWRYRFLDLLLNLPVQAIDRCLSAGSGLRKVEQVLDHRNPKELIANGNSHRAIRQWFEGKLRELGYKSFTGHEIRSEINRVSQYDLVMASRSPVAANLYDRGNRNKGSGQRGLDLAS